MFPESKINTNEEKIWLGKSGNFLTPMVIKC